MADADIPGDWIVVNGERRPLPPEGALLALLRSLDIAPEARGVALAVNDELLPRGGWPAQRLRPGDRVEVVRAVQGG